MPPQKEKNLNKKSSNTVDNADVLQSTVFASSINAPQGPPPITQNGDLASKKSPAYSLDEEDKESAKNKGGKNSSTAGDDDNQDGSGNDDGNVHGNDKKKKEDKNTIKNADSKTKEKEGEKKAPEKELDEKKKGEDGKQKEGLKNASKKSKNEIEKAGKKQNADKKQIGSKMQAVQSATTNATNNLAPKSSSKSNIQPSIPQSIKRPAKSAGKKKVKSIVVNKENLNFFNQSDIAKKTPSGNAVIATDKRLNSNQKKASKPLPQAAIQAQKAATVAANSAFRAATMAKIDGGIGEYKAEAASKKQRLNISSVLALQQIETQKGLAEIGINSEFQKNVSALENHYSGLKASASAKLAEFNAFVENSFAQGNQQIEQKFQEALAKSNQMAQDTIAKAGAVVDNHIDRVRNAAKTHGASAKKQGYDRYDAIMKEKLPDTSTWDDVWDGSDYERNKREARAKAVRTLGKETEAKFLETAEETAAELLKSKSGIADEINESVGKLSETFTEQKSKAVEGQTTLKEQALSKGKAKIDAYLGSLDSQKQVNIQSLTSMKDAKLNQLNATANSLKSNVTTQVSELRQSLELQATTTLSQLQKAKSSIDSVCAQSLEVSTSAYMKTVSEQSNQFESIKSGAMQSLSEVSSQIDGIKDAGNNAGDSLNAFKETSIQEMANVVNTAKTTSSNTHQSTMSSIDSEKATTKTNFDGAVKSYSAQNAHIIASVGQSFVKATTDIDNNIKENADKVIQGFEQEMAAFPKTMSEHEAKAEKSVKPRWKKLLSVVIDIVFAVALAVIVAVIVASGLGIIGMLIAGAIAGAVLGVGKQMLNNAIDGEPIMKDTLKAAALGAVEGVFGVLTGGVGGKILGKAGGKLASMGANSVVAAGTKIGQKAATKVIAEVAANVGEAVTKQIIENLFDENKKWHDGLLKTVATGTIDSVIGMGANKVSGGIIGKTNLGKQVGESTTRKVMREGIGLSVDFAGNSLSSGVGNVANNWQDIMDGDEGFLDSFKDGAVNDWDSNLLKSSTRNVKGAVTDRVNDRLASRKIGKEGISTTDPGEGYKFSMDKGELSIRKTHDLDSQGNKLEDKKFSDYSSTPQSHESSDQDTKPPVQKPQVQESDDSAQKPPKKEDSEQTLPKEQVQTPKKPTVDEEDIKKTTPDSEQEVKTKDDDTSGSTTADKTKQKGSLDEDGYRMSKSAQIAKGRGLPPAGEHYRYNMGKNGEIYIQRIRKVVDGEEIPVKKIENGEVVTTGDKGGEEGGATLSKDRRVIEDEEDDIPRMGFENVDQFAATFDKDKKLSSALRGESWNYFKQGKWAELEELFNANKMNDGWPPNRGFVRITEGSMAVGTMIDRYGGYIDRDDGLFKDKGTFVSPLGASFESRALPASTLDKPLKKYRVIKEIPGVKSGEAIPWFGQPGGGIQHELPVSINKLIEGGFIEEISTKKTESGGEETTEVKTEVEAADITVSKDTRVATKGVDDLVGFRKDHILNRHRAGAGKPGKTEFPAEWSDQKILDVVNKIANDPNAPGGVGKWDSPYKTGIVDGVEIRVDFYPSTHPKHAGKVSTAYPTNTTPNPSN